MNTKFRKLVETGHKVWPLVWAQWGCQQDGLGLPRAELGRRGPEDQFSAAPSSQNVSGDDF